MRTIIALIAIAGGVIAPAQAKDCCRCNACQCQRYEPSYSRYSSDKRSAIQKVRAYNYRHGLN